MDEDGYDPVTGRPLDGHTEALETLSDRELEAELTIAVHTEKRGQRYERLWRELLDRRRGYREHTPSAV